MSKIAVLTDSAANLPAEWVDELEITVVPHNIHWGDETFLDGVTITPAEFYQRLVQASALPTTSQPSAQAFLAGFEGLVDRAEGIVAPLISAGLSGAIDSAVSAARQFDALPVEVVDTRVTAVGQEMIVLGAARAASQGGSLADVKQVAERMARDLEIYFAVDTLEYLHRGGRIGGASRFMGTVLNIKPILYMTGGKIDALERARTSKRAITRLLELAETKAGGKPAMVGILHADRAALAEEVRQQLEERIDCTEVIIQELSPVISVHVGPGTLGVAVCPV